MAIETTLKGMAALLMKAERDMAKPAADHGSPFHEALKHACVTVLVEAQTSLGEYQQASGPFAAWPQLAAATMEDRQRKGYTPDEPLHRSGDMRRSLEWTIKGHVGHVGTDNPYAEFMELGTTKVPARSFLGAAAFRKEYVIHKMFAKAAANVLGGRWYELDRMVLPSGPASRG